MKLVYITGDTGIEVGGRKGAATHIRETCHALVEAGHEVLLLATAVGDESQLPCRTIHVQPPTSKYIGTDGRYLLLDRWLGAEIRRQLLTWQPDAVYERYALYQTAGQRLCHEHGIPRVLEVNTLLANEQRTRLKFPALAAWYERRLWRREKAMLCVSSDLKRRMIESADLDESRMAGFVVSPVSVSPAIFHPAVAPADMAQYGLSGRKIAGYVGTLTAWHGVDTLFEAAVLLRDRKSEIVIIAIGGEPDRVDRLRQRVRDEGLEQHLVFSGSIPHREVPSHMAAMDVCLIPDTQDWSSPTKFFEIAAMGRAIVAADRPSVLEVMGDGESTGLVFRRGDAGEMVAAMERVVADPALAMRIGDAARRRVLENYTWSHNVARIMKLIEAQRRDSAK